MESQNHIYKIKGYDATKIPFTAFIICNDEEMIEIYKSRQQKINIDINKYNIVYKMIGHDNNDTVKNMVIEYVNKINSKQNETDNLFEE